MYACMHACVHACMHACMYVCFFAFSLTCNLITYYVYPGRKFFVCACVHASFVGIVKSVHPCGT